MSKIVNQFNESKLTQLPEAKIRGLFSKGNLALGWSMWWRSWLPIIILTVILSRNAPFPPADPGPSMIIFLGASIAMSYLCGRTINSVAYKKYQIVILPSIWIGWAIVWRTFLLYFLLGGVVGGGLFVIGAISLPLYYWESPLFGSIFIIAVGAFCMITAIGWVTNRTIRRITLFKKGEAKERHAISTKEERLADYAKFLEEKFEKERKRAKE